jgi:hypothetical protein
MEFNGCYFDRTQENRPKVHVTIPQKRAGQPDCPERTELGRTRSTARVTTRQRQYDESTFLAQLAEVLRRHGMAVRTTRTSSSMMRDITDQLA